MSRFSKYRPPFYQFYEPERLTTAQANLRRVQAALKEHERAWAQYSELSRVAKKIVDEPTSNRLTKDRLAVGPRRLQIAAALSQFKEKDFADPQLRSAYRELRRSQGGQQKVTPPGSSNRYYNPTGEGFVNMISGAPARLTGWTNAGLGKQAGWLPRWARAHEVLPCIERKVRREVMFALGRAGRGYHSKKRRTANSEVPC